VTALTPVGDGFLIEGDLDINSVADLIKSEGRILATASRVAVVDLARVERADSVGLALLLRWMREAAKQGGTVRFLNVPRSLTAIAGLCSVEDLLDPAN
jgi:phospholipid transport system transporter-binding protein